MHRSLTAQLPLSRYRIDRDHLTRERPRLFEELWSDPHARVVALWRGEVLVAEDDDAPALEYLTTDRVPTGLLRIYLGRALEVDPALPAGSPIVAAVFNDETAEALGIDIARWRSPRTLGHRLGDRDAGLAIEALGIANWHETHLFSPRTGNPTTPSKGGWVRVDDEDGREMFPRTDAAIIVGITDAQDRMVLGSNALWESNRYSLLAGFVEPGESLEAAVVREVFEETRLRISDPQYVGSQPWPFPASLMLGFRATLDATLESVLRPDGTEILDLRWFSRDDLADDRRDIILPGRTSIARSIIEEWYGGPLEDS